MKLSAIKSNEKLAKENLNFSIHHDASDIDVDIRCYWILSILGGLLLGGIWLASVFMNG
jgi:hypothetical protein